MALYGNFTLDTISSRGITYRSFGGPPVYAGLLLATAPVKLTVFGCAGEAARPAVAALKELGAEVVEPCGCSETTEFSLSREKRRARVLRLGCRIALDQEVAADMHYVNPVIGELEVEALGMMKGGKVYLDPQGFIRRRKAGDLEHAGPPDELDRAADIIKASGSEAKLLMRVRPREGLLTFERGFARLIYPGIEYRLKVVKRLAFDGIGAGDLFGAGFVLGELLGGPEAALAYGQAAASARIGLRGALKVPEFSEVKGLAEELIKHVVARRRAAENAV